MKDSSEKVFNELLATTNELLKMDLSKEQAEKAANLIGGLADKLEKNLKKLSQNKRQAA